MKLLALRLSLLPVICLWSTARTQVETAQNPFPEDVLPYNVDAVCFASTVSAQSRLDVFLQIPYANLAFVKLEDGYLASYEVTIDLYDSTARLHGEKVWTEEVRAPTFEESTSSQGYSLTQRTFEVPPGKFSLVTAVSDNETKRAIRSTREIQVPDFHRSGFALSNILLVGRLTQNEEKKVIVPHVSSNVGSLADGFFAFFEAYNLDSLGTIKIATRVYDYQGEKVFGEESRQHLVPGRNQLFVRVDNSGFTMGDYTLHVQAFADGDDSLLHPLSTTQRPFIVRWRGMPVAAKDMELAIEQLQYIANPGDVDHINEATVDAERRKRFVEFWRKKDPNPNTPRNEAMEEYYAKVEYANKHFRHYIEGWRTDMGMVYIIFGAPNNVDRHPFDIDSKPYEVWSYYDMNHQFTFVDETGFGDYRLTTPIWEVWQRPR